jgi:hypothetical protein
VENKKGQLELSSAQFFTDWCARSDSNARPLGS